MNHPVPHVPEKFPEHMSQEKGVAYIAARKSLERIQAFDSSALPRTADLGKSLDFSEAVSHANRLVDLYRQLPLECLGDLSLSRLSNLQKQANHDFNILNQILIFTPEIDNPATVRAGLIDQLKAAYDPTFDVLHPYIAYATHRSTDFTKLNREAREVLQEITDSLEQSRDTLGERQAEADSVLTAIRKIAAEQGVSQQAHYFDQESNTHTLAAQRWLWTLVGTSTVLFCYAIGSVFIHKIPLLQPTSTYETTQLAVSKVLIFGTISYFLLLSAKNYSAHRHNQVVNQHRKNALLTYEAIVKAAGDQGNRDIILSKAAECIFEPQASGYSKTDSGDGSYSVVSLSPGALKHSP